MSDKLERIKRGIIASDGKIVLDIGEYNTLIELFNERSSQLTTAQEQVKVLREALTRLVSAKDWKNKHGKDEVYRSIQPVAWHLARQALKTRGARIKANRVPKYLGAFELKCDAIRARKDAEREYSYHENHGKVKQ